MLEERLNFPRILAEDSVSQLVNSGYHYTWVWAFWKQLIPPIEAGRNVEVNRVFCKKKEKKGKISFAPPPLPPGLKKKTI